MARRIRPYTPADREALRTICRTTAGRRPFLPLCEDPELGPLLYLDPYLATEPEACFVAEVDGEPVGYIVGTVDTREHRRRALAYHRAQLPQLAVHMAGHGLSGGYRHRISARNLAGELRAILRGGEGYGRSEVDEHVDLRRFPAHCHMQLLPEHRSPQLGLALVMKFRKHLKTMGIKGQHSSVSEPEDEQGYSRLVTSLGFVTVMERRFDRSTAPYLMDDGTWISRVLTWEARR